MFTPVLPKIEMEAISQQYGRFIIGPLESGYGTTLGNALRRVLLSSLTGAAVTSIRILDVPHEFAAIPHVREDVMQMVLNIKQLRLQMHGDGPMRMVLEAKGEGIVTAGDIKAPPEVEILNPDMRLFTTDSSDARIEIEFNVEKGRGYSPAEDRGRLPIEELPVDAIFSPIQRVAFTVDKARVGQMTNYDRLVMEIWTDGRTSPMDALKETARIMVTHLRLIAGITEEPEEEEPEEVGVPSRIYDIPIENLSLSVRVFNALKRAGISKVGEVLDMMGRGEEVILTIRNFGEKSLVELEGKMNELGYAEYLEESQSSAE